MIDKITIPFTKQSIKQIPKSDLPPGAKGLELAIKTNFLATSLISLDGIFHGPIADFTFEKLAFVFKDNTEQEIYNSLLNSANKNFELNFEKSKVFLNVAGFANVIDETKPEVSVNAGEKSIIIFLKPKFAGIITLNTTNNEIPAPDGPQPIPQPRPSDEAIRIKELEDKIKEMEQNEDKIWKKWVIPLGVISIILLLTSIFLLLQKIKKQDKVVSN